MPFDFYDIFILFLMFHIFYLRNKIILIFNNIIYYVGIIMLQSDNAILNLWVYFQLVISNFLPELLSIIDHANFLELECEEEE